MNITIRASGAYFGWAALTLLAGSVVSVTMCLATRGHDAGFVFCLIANGYLAYLGSRAGFEAIDEILQEVPREQ